jgi:hypothetical protein
LTSQEPGGCFIALAQRPAATYTARQYSHTACPSEVDLALRSNPVSKRMVLERLGIDLATEPRIEAVGWDAGALSV